MTNKTSILHEEKLLYFRLWVYEPQSAKIEHSFTSRRSGNASLLTNNAFLPASFVSALLTCLNGPINKNKRAHANTFISIIRFANSLRLRAYTPAMFVQFNNQSERKENSQKAKTSGLPRKRIPWNSHVCGRIFSWVLVCAPKSCLNSMY